VTPQVLRSLLSQLISAETSLGGVHGGEDVCRVEWREMVSLNVTVSQVILYAFGPFFCYPWKPVFNTFGGASYATGYKHFWLQHQDPFNLLWHLICLIYQVLGNFTLLLLVDQYLFGTGRWISKATALIWILYLGSAKQAPAMARLYSLVAIGLAYQLVPYLNFSDVEYFVGGSFLVIWILQAVFRGPYIGGDAPLILLLLLVKCSFSPLLHSYSGLFKQYSLVIGVIYLMTVSLIATRLDAVKTLIVAAALLGHLLSIFTTEDLFYFHSIAFTAMLCQGLSHELSKETATLIKLMDQSNHSAKVAYEWSHVTYFPNFLFHACLDCYKIQKNKLNKGK
jgi:hypothetical protein